MSKKQQPGRSGHSRLYSSGRGARRPVFQSSGPRPLFPGGVCRVCSAVERLRGGGCQGHGAHRGVRRSPSSAGLSGSVRLDPPPGAEGLDLCSRGRPGKHLVDCESVHKFLRLGPSKWWDEDVRMPCRGCRRCGSQTDGVGGEPAQQSGGGGLPQGAGGRCFSHR